MTQAEAIKEAIAILYAMSAQVAPLEASYVESWQLYGCETPLQRMTLARMVEKYLPTNEQLAAEILGQERLV